MADQDSVMKRAEKVSVAAAKLGFDWDSAEEALAKVQEETQEVLEALGGEGVLEEELGDLLFSVVNVARKSGVDPESALSSALDKFQERFDRLCETLQQRGIDVEEASLDEMEGVWNEIKHLKPS